MSWDAYLVDDRGHWDADFNYTHNTNKMVAAALLASEGSYTSTTSKLPTNHLIAKAIGPAWYERLNGMSGVDGVRFLQSIIAELESNPAHYRTFNPPNGWGDYDSLLSVLKQMRDSVPTGWPTKWEVSG